MPKLQIAGMVAAVALAMPFEASAAERSRSVASSSSEAVWVYSGVIRRQYVRNQSDCPCQVVVRSFRSRRTYECPCLSKR